VGAGGVLGVADVDGVGAGGYLQAFAALAVAVGGLAPGVGDLQAFAAFAPTVARLEPGEFLDAHSSPSFFSINAWDSVGGSAIARMIP
jgi:hypothetical protein